MNQKFSSVVYLSIAFLVSTLSMPAMGSDYSIVSSKLDEQAKLFQVTFSSDSSKGISNNTSSTSTVSAGTIYEVDMTVQATYYFDATGNAVLSKDSVKDIPKIKQLTIVPPQDKSLNDVELNMIMAHESDHESKLRTMYYLAFPGSTAVGSAWSELYILFEGSAVSASIRSLKKENLVNNICAKVAYLTLSEANIVKELQSNTHIVNIQGQISYWDAYLRYKDSLGTRNNLDYYYRIHRENVRLKFFKLMQEEFAKVAPSKLGAKGKSKSQIVTKEVEDNIPKVCNYCKTGWGDSFQVKCKSLGVRIMGANRRIIKQRKIK